MEFLFKEFSFPLELFSTIKHRRSTNNDPLASTSLVKYQLSASWQMWGQAYPGLACGFWLALTYPGSDTVSHRVSSDDATNDAAAVF